MQEVHSRKLQLKNNTRYFLIPFTKMANQVNNENGKVLTMFQDSLKQIKDPGKYEYGPFIIEAIKIRSHEGILIKNFKKR